MKKLNIAKLLKDCPTGMELDSTLFEGLEFDCIVDNEYLPIRCRIKHPNGGYTVYNFTKYGCWLDTTFAKCVIFPKGKTTWEGFQRPFKDGDILVGKGNQPFIFKKLNNRDGCFSYCGIDSGHRFLLASTDWAFANSLRFATEEEKQKLFDAIKENGHKWNDETKTLEKLPKFKVGDRIKNKTSKNIYTITDIRKDEYIVKQDDDRINYHLAFCNEIDWELVPNKFDITTLKPFDKVLVRDNNTQKWTADLFSFFDKSMIYPYACVGHYINQCIPYNDETKHLLGTTNDCDEYYKNWE